jgi:hypothetical protein
MPHFPPFKEPQQQCMNPPPQRADPVRLQGVLQPSVPFQIVNVEAHMPSHVTE